MKHVEELVKRDERIRKRAVQELKWDSTLSPDQAMRRAEFQIDREDFIARNDKDAGAKR